LTGGSLMRLECVWVWVCVCVFVCACVAKTTNSQKPTGKREAREKATGKSSDNWNWPVSILSCICEISFEYISDQAWLSCVTEIDIQTDRQRERERERDIKRAEIV